MYLEPPLASLQLVAAMGLLGLPVVSPFLVFFLRGRPVDLSPFAALSTLKITFNITNKDSDISSPMAPLLFSTICTVPQLKLGLHRNRLLGDQQSGLFSLEHIESLHILPPNLHRLEDTTWLLLSPSYLSAFLADTSVLPSLEHMCLSIWAVKDNRDMYLRSRVEVEEVEKAAKDRGLVIEWSGEEDV